MIPIQRLDEPEVLRKNKARWCAAFLERRAKSPEQKPSSSQYAHAQVVSTLEAMSHHKCFYCEQKTKETTCEVDHHVEVAERPDLAFEWTNLYLSCPVCNSRKQPNRSIPIADCLDPCDPAVDPSAHLDFDDELIRARAGSSRGLATIKKYKLDRDDLDLKRARQLKLLLKAIIEIKARMIAEGRKTMTERELELLRSFAQPDFPFSLMFSVYLERYGYLERKGA